MNGGEVLEFAKQNQVPNRGPEVRGSLAAFQHSRQ